MKKWIRFLLCLFANFVVEAVERPFVMADLHYELGNQMFTIAAAVSLAIDHGCAVYFPDLERVPHWNIPLNREKIFWRLNSQQPRGAVEYHYQEPRCSYVAIPYRPNMKICGYFHSEKYFAHHKQEIVNLFAPSKEILRYLVTKYRPILRHPNSVAIHVRTYMKDYGHLPGPREVNAFTGVRYYERAVSLFPKDALFVIFSDRIDWCKQNLSHLAKNLIFIEGESHYHDFYLMSLCKHNIIANSTFSWWGAYLNRNPHKVVVAPKRWVGTPYYFYNDDLLPDSWVRVSCKE